MNFLRLDNGFLDHYKHDRVARLLDLDRDAAALVVLRLILWVARYKDESGDISGLAAPEIAAICHFPGNPDRLVDALVEARWLDREPAGRLLLHEWTHYQREYISDRQRKRDERSRDREGIAPDNEKVRNVRGQSGDRPVTGAVDREIERELPPLPPRDRGGPRRTSRSPSPRHLEAADLLQLGAHRPVPQPDEAEQRAQDAAFAADFRSAERQARAQGDEVLAAKFAAQAAELEQSTGRPAAGGGRA